MNPQSSDPKESAPNLSEQSTNLDSVLARSYEKSVSPSAPPLSSPPFPPILVPGTSGAQETSEQAITEQESQNPIPFEQNRFTTEHANKGLASVVDPHAKTVTRIELLAANDQGIDQEGNGNEEQNHPTNKQIGNRLTSGSSASWLERAITDRENPDENDSLSMQIGTILNTDPHADQREIITIDSVKKNRDKSTANHGEKNQDEKLRDAIKGYEIEKELGRGGMGVVYQARNRQLNRQAALKMILSGIHASAQERHRFRQEAEAVALLQHPNIVQIYEVNEADSCPYIAFEYVEGGTLADFLDGNPWQSNQAALMIEILSTAIQSAHERGIIHRDLKPGNILLAINPSLPILDKDISNPPYQALLPAIHQRKSDSRLSQDFYWVTPKITDFGLAKRVEEESSNSDKEVTAGNRTDSKNISQDESQIDSNPRDNLANGNMFEGETSATFFNDFKFADSIDSAQSKPTWTSKTGSDFSIPVWEKEAFTRTGAVVGTPSYLAPEQAAGKNRGLGAGVDIYALGSILYELITGRPPFRGETALDTILQVMHQEPIPPGQLQPKLPRDLETICLKCLQKQPSRRYLSARELAEDLNRFRHGKPILARPVSNWERLWKWSRRHPAIATMGIASLMLVLILLGISIYFNIRLRTVADLAKNRAEEATEASVRAEQAARSALQQTEIANEEKRKTNEALKQLESANEETIRRAQISDRNALALLLARVAVSAERNPKTALDLLEKAPIESRGFVWGYLHQFCNRLLHEWHQWRPGNPSVISSVAFSPDGTLAAAITWDGRVWLYDVQNYRPLVELRIKSRLVLCMAFSPDGHWLVCGDGDGYLHSWHVPENLTDSRSRMPLGYLPASWIWSAHRRAVRAVAFSPTSGTLASTGDDGYIRLWQLKATPAIPGIIMGAFAFNRYADHLKSEVNPVHSSFLLKPLDDSQRLPIWGLAWSPDGARIAAGGQGKTVYIWSVQEPLDVAPLATFKEDIAALAWSPDPQSDLLAISLNSQKDTSIHLWQVGKIQLQTKLRGHTRTIYALAFTSDGKKLISGSADRSLRIWDIDSLQEKMILNGHNSSVRSLAISPNRDLLLSGDFNESVRLWSISTPKQTVIDLDLPVSPTIAKVSPDQRWFAVSGADSFINLYRIFPRPGTGKIELILAEKFQTTLENKANLVNLGFNESTKQFYALDSSGKISLWTMPALNKSLPKRDIPRRKFNFPTNNPMAKKGPLLPKKENTERGPKEQIRWPKLGDSPAKKGDRIPKKEKLEELAKTEEKFQAPVVTFSIPEQKRVFVSCASANGRFLFTASDSSIYQTDLVHHTSEKICPLSLRARAISLSPDGNKLAVASISSIEIWDLASKSRDTLEHFENIDIESIYFLPANLALKAPGTTQFKILVTFSNGLARIFDFYPLKEGKEGSTAKVPDRSIQEDLIISENRFRMVPGIELNGHNDVIKTVVLSHKQDCLVTAGVDRSLRIWDALVGAEQANLSGHPETIIYSHFLANDSLLLTLGSEGIVRIWNAARSSPSPFNKK